MEKYKKTGSDIRSKERYQKGYSNKIKDMVRFKESINQNKDKNIKPAFLDNIVLLLFGWGFKK